MSRASPVPDGTKARPLLLWTGPVVIDVALRGMAGRRNDVDNVAHKLMRAMHLVVGRDALPLMGYRVYRQAWPVDDVRVRLMPKIRLEALGADD